MNINPILAQVTRNELVECIHRGSFAIVDISGEVIASQGNIATPIYPRSAIKALQALPLVESGAAEAFGFTKAELALACSSHIGETLHIEAARSILKKASIDESALECGPQWPIYQKAARELAIDGKRAQDIHNTCSGKHAGMLATAKHMGEPLEGYTKAQHPVQRRILDTMSELCGCELVSAPCGIDGCSAPTWAMPLKNMAWGFAKITDGTNEANAAGNWGKSAAVLLDAVKQEPFMVAGSGEFCTDIMKAVPRLFAKTGAEGVYCGAIRDCGIGIAVKCDDGAKRAAQVIFAKALTALPVWSDEERDVLLSFSNKTLKNRRGTSVGVVRGC